MANNNTEAGNRDSGSVERVAYDLMHLILSQEKVDGPNTTRAHVLELYAICLAVTTGGVSALKTIPPEKLKRYSA